jgi:hypothetical protein
MEPELHASVSEPGYDGGCFVQLRSLNDGVVRSAGEVDVDQVAADNDVGAHVDKLAENGRSPALLEPPELLRQGDFRDVPRIFGFWEFIKDAGKHPVVRGGFVGTGILILIACLFPLPTA